MKQHQPLWAHWLVGWIKPVFQYSRNRLLGIKDKEDHPNCYQQKVLRSIITWGCVSILGKDNVSFFYASISAEKYRKAFRATYAALIFSRDILAFFNMTKQNHILYTFQRLWKKRVLALDWPDLCQVENAWRIMKLKI